MRLPILFFLFIVLQCFVKVKGESLEIKRNEDVSKPNYTSIHWNVSYRSLGHPQVTYSSFISTYYKIVEFIVDLILPDALPDELFTLQAGETLWSHTTGCIWAYRRLSIFIVLLLVQIFFLIGSNIRVLCSALFFCGECCSTSAPISGKLNKRIWLPWLYTILLLLLLTIVLAHQTNQNMDQGMDTVMLTLDDTLQDIEAFVDATLHQLEILLLTNMREYLTFFLKSGERTTMNILKDVEGVISTLDFSKELENIENSFKFIKPVFDEIEKVLNEIESVGKEINKDIAGLKSLVKGIMCDTKECEELKNMIPSLESIYDGGASAIDDTYAELGNLVNLGKDTVKEGLKEIGNLTSMIGGKISDEGKALKNLTANIAGNVINELEVTGGSLTNITSNIGSKALEEGRALENLTANIAGNVINKLEVTGGNLANITSNIGGKVIEEGKAIQNLTGNIINKLEVTGGSLKNITSAIGDGALEKGKALENLTANIAGNVVNNLEDTGKSLTNISGKIVGGIGNVAGGLGKEIGKEGKAIKDITKDVTGAVVGDLNKVAGGLEKKVGGLLGGLGDWTFGSGDKKDKPKNVKKIVTTTSSPTGKTNKKGVLDKVTKGIGSGIGNIFGFGGFAPSGKKTTDVQPEISTTKTEISQSFGGLTYDVDSKVGESEIDLTALLKTEKPNGVKDKIVNVNDFNSLLSGLDAYKQNGGAGLSTTLSSVDKTTKSVGKSQGGFFGGLKNLASKVSNVVEKGEGKLEKVGSAVTGTIGSTSSNLKNGATSILGGLNVWSSGGPTDGKKLQETTTLKHIETTTKRTSGTLLGGLGNLASKGSNHVEKNEESVKGKVGGVEKKLGGLLGGLGGWTSSVPEKSDNKKEVKNKTVQKPIIATTKEDKKKKGASGSLSKVGKTVSGVENKISDASNKLLNMGGSFFGFRRKRGVAMGMGNLKKDFDMIFSTIDKIENYVIKDLKNLNNVSVLLSPAFEGLGGVVKEVLDGVENELEEAAKPIEKYFATALEKIISVENSILNATNVIRVAQGVVNLFEVYRFHISNFIAAALLISFTLVAFGVSIRMKYDNIMTKYAYRGGFTLLHVTALMMALASLTYIILGVTSQKVVCETFDTSYREDNIMRLLSEINPAKFGLLLDLNLHKVIIKCHQDRSLYQVTSLKSVLDVEKLAQDIFDLSLIKKEFEPLFNLNFNFTQYLPLAAIKTIGDNLNFEAFSKILDSPIFKQMEKLEKEFTHIPLVGPVIKKITSKIDSFKDKIMSMKDHVGSANNGFPSFLTNLKKILSEIETRILDVEEKTIGTVHDVVEEFENSLVSSLSDYINNRLIYSIQREIGRCKPISAAFNSTLNSVCRRITTPANGHWFSWFIGVLLSIILIVTSRKIEGQLRRSSYIIQQNSLVKNSEEKTGPDDIELRTVTEIEEEKSKIEEYHAPNEEQPII